MYHPYDMILPFNIGRSGNALRTRTVQPHAKPADKNWDALARWEDEGGALPQPPAGSISAARRASQR